MSAVAMGETSRTQKPVVTPRRKPAGTYAREASRLQCEGISASKSTSDLSAMKVKPARPEPPKLRPGVPPPLTPPPYSKKSVVVVNSKVPVRKASPPSGQLPATDSKQLLQSAASWYYGRNSNSYATVPAKGSKRGRQGSTEEDSQVYMNVAPKVPQSTKLSNRTTNKAANVSTGSAKSSPSSSLRSAIKRSWRSSAEKVSDSRLEPKSHSPSAKFSPGQKHLSPAEKQRLIASISVPLSSSHSMPANATRQDFTKQTPPKGPSKSGRMQPMRPAPPRPYSQRKTSADVTAAERTETIGLVLDRGLAKSVPDGGLEEGGVEEYCYVDPTRCRYEMNLEALDLSTTAESIYVNDITDLPPEYTPLSSSTISENAVYTVPDRQITSPPVLEDAVYTVPDCQPISPPLVEVSNISPSREPERSVESVGQAKGLYANVAPRPPSRSKSFTLNTSPSPENSFVPSSVVSQFSPPFDSTSTESSSTYTAMSYHTMESPSIYEVPPPLK